MSKQRGVITGYNEPATGHQLHAIACLCQANGIRELLEDNKMTIGEAGLLIRRLCSEQHNRRNQKRSK